MSHIDKIFAATLFASCLPEDSSEIESILRSQAPEAHLSFQTRKELALCIFRAPEKNEHFGSIEKSWNSDLSRGRITDGVYEESRTFSLDENISFLATASTDQSRLVVYNVLIQKNGGTSNLVDSDTSEELYGRGLFPYEYEEADLMRKGLQNCLQIVGY